MKQDEIPTLWLLIGCYFAFLILTYFAGEIGAVATTLLLVPVLVLHSSLQHEFLHGHPTNNQTINDLLVSPALGMFVPYLRFKNTHLAHHYDPALTDPYDDPESNYLDPKVWNALPTWRKTIFRFNNTLIGRMLVGPMVGLMQFYAGDMRQLEKGHRAIGYAYLHHAVGVAAVLFWLVYTGGLSIPAYLLACYAALSVLKIRTFLEHKAHERTAARTVLIEDRGPLAFLFLNNNYHAVHHACPKIAWHRLPHVFNARRDEFLRRNGGYWYQSYWSVFRKYLFTCKDPVAHPLMETSTLDGPTYPHQIIEHGCGKDNRI